MALRVTRLLGLVTLCLFLYMLVLVYRSTTSPFPTSRAPNPFAQGDWQEPNLQLIDQPPGPLHAVQGDNYAASNAASDRINATILSLVRNSELEQLVQSMRDLERTFNSKFNYPWTLFNDEPFTEHFKDTIRQHTAAEVRFELIPREHWEVPPWIDDALYQESVAILVENDVQYADKVSYHQMCRWNSGFFPHHPALRDVQYYWRVEPNVRFFCDIDYDVFRFMRDHNKTYGFTLNIYDAPQSLPTLWPETLEWLADPTNARAVHPNSARAWLEDAGHRPEHNQKAQGYSTCHFWSNFEIGDLAFWRSEAYTSYFQHLDRAGGFFYERWGDAPVHSIALGLLEDRDRIHWFRDIGYNHVPFLNCPTRADNKCSGCEEGRFHAGEDWLVKEDCRASWFHHVGLGEWTEEWTEQGQRDVAR